LRTDKKLISTIIATHNRPRLVLETLDSLAGQSWRPLEVVVVDDGSDPSTGEAIRAWQADRRPDFRFQYLWQENQGPAAARNHGFEASSGQRIHFLDDDDLMHADALAQLEAALGRDDGPAIAMASHQYRHADGSAGGLVPPPELSPGATLRSMIRGDWFVPIHGYLFTRAAVRRIGPWNPVLTSQEDDEYLLRAAMAGVALRAAPSALVYYCQHGGVRRATPGKPGETVRQGLEKRLRADLAIRESAFEALCETQREIERYRAAFEAWQARLRARYGPLPANPDPASRLLAWLHRGPARQENRGAASGPEASELLGEFE